tara:strand:+ start:328 stop:546 length:219 start_codon:yes stop_codon:yes gene_type:complete
MEQGGIGTQRHDRQLKNAQSAPNSRGIGLASFSANRPLPINIDVSTQKSTAGEESKNKGSFLSAVLLRINQL